MSNEGRRLKVFTVSKKKRSIVAMLTQEACFRTPGGFVVTDSPDCVTVSKNGSNINKFECSFEDIKDLSRIFGYLLNSRVQANQDISGAVNNGED